MNIFITLKSVLNYLYNHLIELIWVKKIKFSDGSEMVSAGGSNLKQADYFEEIKVIEQTDMTGDIKINKDIYYSKVSSSRFVIIFAYDGNNWIANDNIQTLNVNLSDYGIDLTDVSYSANSSFAVYSVCLRNKTSFVMTSLIHTIYDIYLNGQLMLKSDYYIDFTNIDGIDHPTINFNNYILKYSDTLSIMNGEINESNK